MKNKKVEIVLKSDLCAGSGYSYAGVVDSDICYTDYGIPYIPSRRLKGCLKEAAGMIGVDKDAIDVLFGIGGNDEPGLLRIDNAYISDNDVYEKQIEAVNSNTDKKYFDTGSVLRQFTNIRALTAIDSKSGTAKENSLRFIRTVNHYRKDGETVFQLQIEYPEEYEKQIVDIFKSMRNIGLDRNRGLGSVACRLIDGDDSDSHFEIADRDYDENKDYIIRYSIRNMQPLMLSNDSAGESETFISGQSVLGFFAGKLKNSEYFDDIVLNGKTVYSNLYPVCLCDVDGFKSSKRMYPVPSFINRLKKTKEVVNILINDPNYEIEAGNQPKKCNGYCCFEENGSIILFQPELDIVYHHTGRSENNPDGLLYSLTKLNEGQMHAGYILTKGYLVKNLLGVLKDDDMYFGKSKSVQYGKCIVEDIDVQEFSIFHKEYKAGEKIVITLKSDGIFINDSGCYTTYPDEVKQIIAGQLGFDYVRSSGGEESGPFDQVSTKYITGYNSKWNLKKPSFSAIGAGSAFIYELKNEVKIVDGFVGEKNLEGFGEFMTCRLSEMNYLLKESAQQGKTDQEFPENVKDELCEVILDQLYTDLLDSAVKNSRDLKISSSLLGRVALMVRQSAGKNDLIKRIASIKSESSKNKVMSYIEKTIGKKDEPLNLGFSDSEEYALLKRMGKADSYINGRWKNYLLKLLAQEKYLQKNNTDGGYDHD